MATCSIWDLYLNSNSTTLQPEFSFYEVGIKHSSLNTTISSYLLLCQFILIMPIKQSQSWKQWCGRGLSSKEGYNIQILFIRT